MIWLERKKQINKLFYQRNVLKFDNKGNHRKRAGESDSETEGERKQRQDH